MLAQSLHHEHAHDRSKRVLGYNRSLLEIFSYYSKPVFSRFTVMAAMGNFESGRGSFSLEKLVPSWKSPAGMAIPPTKVVNCDTEQSAYKECSTKENSN